MLPLASNAAPQLLLYKVWQKYFFFFPLYFRYDWCRWWYIFDYIFSYWRWVSDDDYAAPCKYEIRWWCLNAKRWRRHDDDIYHLRWLIFKPLFICTRWRTSLPVRRHARLYFAIDADAGAGDADIYLIYWCRMTQKYYYALLLLFIFSGAAIEERRRGHWGKRDIFAIISRWRCRHTRANVLIFCGKYLLLLATTAATLRHCHTTIIRQSQPRPPLCNAAHKKRAHAFTSKYIICFYDLINAMLLPFFSQLRLHFTAIFELLWYWLL